MSLTLAPLLITQPSPTDPDFTTLHGEYTLLPSASLGHIYTHYAFPEDTYDTGTFVAWVDYIFEHSYTTGVGQRTKLVSAICGISHNELLCDPAFSLGTDNKLYAITTSGEPAIGSPPWWMATMCLSQINPSTLAESDTLVPYAVTNAYDLGSENSFQIAPFRLNGTDYAALVLCNVNSGASNFEIVNLGTMASVGTEDYSSETLVRSWVVVADQPASDKQNFYIWQSRDGTGGEGWLYKVQFTQPGTIAVTTILTTTATYYDSCGLIFDPNDGNVMLWANDGPGSRYFVKLSTTDGSEIWRSDALPRTPSGNFDGNANIPHRVMCQQNVAGGSYVFFQGGNYPSGYTPPWTDVANKGTYLTFDTSDGSYTTATSQYLYDALTASSPISVGELNMQMFTGSSTPWFVWVAPQFRGGTYPYYTTEWIGGWMMITDSSGGSPPDPVGGSDTPVPRTTRTPVYVVHQLPPHPKPPINICRVGEAQTVFPVSFRVMEQADLRVTVDGVELSQGDFTFAGYVQPFPGWDDAAAIADDPAFVESNNPFPGFKGGQVTLNTAAENATVVIWSDPAAQRTTDFVAGELKMAPLNRAFERLWVGDRAQHLHLARAQPLTFAARRELGADESNTLIRD